MDLGPGDLNMRFGRWLAVAEPYGGNFVTPFEDDDVFIGRRIFEELGKEGRFKVRPAPDGTGIIASLDALDGDTFDPSRTNALVRRLYEETTSMRFLQQGIEYSFWGRLVHGVFRRLIAAGMQQLYVPAQAELPSEVEADVLYIDLDHDGRHDYRAWVRTFESGGVFYVGAVSVHRRPPERGRAYLSLSMPLLRANVAFVFQPYDAAGGGIKLSTRGSPDSDAGVYLIFPGPTRYSLLRLPFVVDEIEVTSCDDALAVDHINRLLGGSFRLRYSIKPKEDS